VLGAATLQQLADEHDVRMCHPLLDPSFLEALAAAGSPFGPVSRAEAMRWLFGAELPADVLKRRSKAYFNTALAGAASRAFAERWDGGGVDTRLVDPERLRHEWLRPRPHAGAFALLQAAWMSTRGWPLTGGQ
jgi:asparagine synthase (glutamine-hydrolysing)